MFNSKIFTLLHKTLDFRTQRQDLLTSNIANKDTPGYKAEDMVCEKSLEKALHADEPGLLNIKDPRHFDGRNTPPLEMVKGQRSQKSMANTSLKCWQPTAIRSSVVRTLTCD